MGLDWIVNIYEKNTFIEIRKGLNKEITTYIGPTFIRGKAVVHLLNKYGESELAEECYGKDICDEHGDKVGSFITIETLSKIYDVLSSYELKKEEEWSVEEQYSFIHEGVGRMVYDLKDYNGYCDLRVLCWY